MRLSRGRSTLRRLVLAMSFTLLSSSSSRADERADWGGRRRRRAQCWRAYRVHDNGGLPAGGANVAACIVACSDVSGESCDLSALSAPDSERRQKRKQHGDEDGHSHPGRLNGALLVRRGGRALIVGVRLHDAAAAEGLKLRTKMSCQQESRRRLQLRHARHQQVAPQLTTLWASYPADVGEHPDGRLQCAAVCGQQR